MKIANAQIESYIQKIAETKVAGCLVYGPEASLVSYRSNIIAKKICPDLADPFLVVHVGKERLAENKSILAEEFFSFSMLGGRKIIIVKNCDNSAASALKEIFSDSEYAKKRDNFILIEAGDLDKASALRKVCEDNYAFAAIACYEDDERFIKSFIADELRRNELNFNREIVDLIYEKIGKNRQIIHSEINKIKTFLGLEKNLNQDSLLELIELQSEISANEFVMNFAAHKFSIALIQAERLLNEGFEAITLIRFLANYLQKIYQAKVDIEVSGLDFDEAVKLQKLFFKTEIEFRRHLKLFSIQVLKKILINLAEIEIKIKNSNTKPRLLFTGFIASFLAE